MTRQRLITGVSGASAPQLAWTVLGAPHASHAVETHLVLSIGAEKTIEAEMGLTRGSFEALADASHHPPDMGAAISSGSFLLPLYLSLGLERLLNNDPAMPDEDICLDYVADKLWLTGSPDTAASPVTELYKQTAGFGYLLITCYDAAREQEASERSLRLLTDQVLPACRRACQDTALAPEEAA
jgi:hypothetical protein